MLRNALAEQRAETHWAYVRTMLAHLADHCGVPVRAYRTDGDPFTLRFQVGYHGGPVIAVPEHDFLDDEARAWGLAFKACRAAWMAWPVPEIPDNITLGSE